QRFELFPLFYPFFEIRLSDSCEMKLKGIFAIISIFSIIIGGVLQGLGLPFGKAIIFLGVGILIFVYIPLFLLWLSRK
ncbi:MAG: hypothetical protein O2951_14865, partial [Bacteroidetes bacterium]|nr:hypothetical protein [Bacteroidota bacterium]